MFTQEISADIFAEKYQYGNKETVVGMWDRLADFASGEENSDVAKSWRTMFRAALDDFKFIPAGRILSNAGTNKRTVTFANCYVQDYIKDDFGGIFDGLAEVAKTLRYGGGVGMDFSKLRPKGAKIYSTGGFSSGPVSFMEIFNASCKSIQAGNRRGAMIATMDIHHYDIDDFITAKKGTDYLAMFNTSVMVTDDFMRALEVDGDWVLTYKEMPTKTYKARKLWDMILQNAYDHAEPGVLFKGTMMEMNNLNYVEGDRIGVNPCGEQVLGMDYGTCLLGQMNLPKYVISTFMDDAAFQMSRFVEDASTAVRFLDNMVELNNYPLGAQKKKAMDTRRIGLGVTGYADALAMLGMQYASEKSAYFTKELFENLMLAVYSESQSLGREKGSFPLFNRKEYIKSGFIKANWSILEDSGVAFDKMRNSHLLSIAPAGTVSILANNVSSGIEPIFELEYERVVRQHGPDMNTVKYLVRDYAYDYYSKMDPGIVGMTDYKFQTYKDISVAAKVETLSAIQHYIDSSISNTTNIPNDYPFKEFREMYRDAYKHGLKGVTVYRQGTMEAVLIDKEQQEKVKDVMSAEEKRVALRRPTILKSTTYKQKMMHNNYYITISDNHDATKKIIKPFEIFINSTVYSPDATAVALLLSAEFRRCETYDDYAFIIHNLRKIQDPNIIVWDGKSRIRSLYQAISLILEKHIAVLKGEEWTAPELNGGLCPKCGVTAVKEEGGCSVCASCGYSSCE